MSARHIAIFLQLMLEAFNTSRFITFLLSVDVYVLMILFLFAKASKKYTTFLRFSWDSNFRHHILDC
jgi:hypothetical protein